MSHGSQYNILNTSASLSGPSIEGVSEEKTNDTSLARLFVDEGTKVLGNSCFPCIQGQHNRIH